MSQLSNSSPGRRNKDLTDILFGSNHVEQEPPLPSVIDSEPSPLGEGTSFFNFDKHASVTENVPPPTIPNVSTTSSVHMPAQAQPEESSPSPIPTSESHEEPVIPDLRAHEDDQAQLMRQVQERTQAAMAQLRKSPQPGRLLPSLQPPGPRKKIHLQDISGPHLIQSSTSVDKLPAVPISPATAAAKGREREGREAVGEAQGHGQQRGVKFSFSKRLRNTLKSRPTQPNGDEVTPWTLENTSTSNSTTTFSSSPDNSHGSLGLG